MAESHEFGTKAEAYAVDFLISKGYCILHRNWRYGHKELDIVCTDGNMLVIVEVKARKKENFPFPEDLISRTKERMILEASEQYLYQYKVRLPVRFDLLIVINNKKGFDVEHMEDAIVPYAE